MTSQEYNTWWRLGMYLYHRLPVERHILEAEDVVQEAIIWLTKKNQAGVCRLDTFDPERGSIRAWRSVMMSNAIRTARTNLMAQYAGSRGDRIEVPMCSLPSEYIEELFQEINPAPDQTTMALVHHLKKNLSARELSMLESYADGLTYREVAAEHGTNTMAAHRTVRQARIRAKAMLRARGYE